MCPCSQSDEICVRVPERGPCEALMAIPISNSQALAFSRRRRHPSFEGEDPPRVERAQGRPGTGWCPWSACRKKARGRTTGSAEDTRPSLRNGFTAYSELSPGTGLFCPRHPQSARCALQELSASVGAPGPHGLAVRKAIVRPHSKKNAAISRGHRCPPPRP
jgi:hypothetical protein